MAQLELERCSIRSHHCGCKSETSFVPGEDYERQTIHTIRIDILKRTRNFWSKLRCPAESVWEEEVELERDVDRLMIGRKRSARAAPGPRLT